ncbi:hypothetical protein MVEN_01787200 [Mycena venus]|uniref:Uncharacterized protein n=1 Tax=Mycena venus TaxID=2733690 RepID=A0A8H6XK70_9AGAR|nr:hypothetical protein MVEN_01787200 [Mycena venus]
MPADPNRFQPAFSPITEESGSQLSPNSFRSRRTNGKLSLVSTPSPSAGGRVEWRPSDRRPSDTIRSLPPHPLLPIGDRPRSGSAFVSTPIVIPPPPLLATNAYHVSPSRSSIDNDDNDHLEPPSRSIFNRQRSGSAPSPIKVVRDSRDITAYNITVTPRVSSSSNGSSPVTADSNNVLVSQQQQTFPETPSAFSPTFSPSTDASASDRNSMIPPPLPVGPRPGYTSIAQQMLLTRAATTVRGARHSRQASMTRARNRSTAIFPSEETANMLKDTLPKSPDDEGAPPIPDPLVEEREEDEEEKVEEDSTPRPEDDLSSQGHSATSPLPSVEFLPDSPPILPVVTPGARGGDRWMHSVFSSPPPYHTVMYDRDGARNYEQTTPRTGGSGGFVDHFSPSTPSIPMREQRTLSIQSIAPTTSGSNRRAQTRPPLPIGPRRPSTSAAGRKMHTLTTNTPRTPAQPQPSASVSPASTPSLSDSAAQILADNPSFADVHPSLVNKLNVFDGTIENSSQVIMPETMYMDDSATPSPPTQAPDGYDASQDPQQRHRVQLDQHKEQLRQINLQQGVPQTEQYTPDGAMRGFVAEDSRLQEHGKSYMAKVGSPHMIQDVGPGASDDLVSSLPGTAKSDTPLSAFPGKSVSLTPSSTNSHTTTFVDLQPAAVPHVSTFIICSPKSSKQHVNTSPLSPEDLPTLKNEFAEGGTIVSVHSPDEAVLWLETHYEDPLLESMQLRGVGGPIAAMLSPDESCLVIFGLIHDGWVLKAAQVLSDLCGFVVMVRPLEHNPIPKWEHSTFPVEISGLAPLDDDQIQINNDLLTSIEEEEEEEDANESDTTSEQSEESMDSATTEDSDTGALYDQDGVLRLRGGSGDDVDPYKPWMSPVHNVDIRLDIHPAIGVSYNVDLLTKIQFKTQTAYENKDRYGPRPQIVSWTKFRVVPKRERSVRADRSYSNITFLVEKQYIFDPVPMECSGFVPPRQTTKTVETSTGGRTTSTTLTVGANPTGALAYAQNNIQTHTVENQNDRVTPKCAVHYHSGVGMVVDGTSYESYEIAYEAAEDLSNNEKDMTHPMEAEFSMGINVGDLEEPNNTNLPRTSFLIQNQTNLWVPDHDLKAKGQGIVVLTTAHIPNIEVTEPLYIKEFQKLELSQKSLINLPATDKTAARYPAKLSLSVATASPPGLKNLPTLQKIVNKLVVKSLTGRKSIPTNPQIPKLRMHEYISRGWDATHQEWRMPIYGSLTSTLQKASKPSETAWDLALDLAADPPGVKSEGKMYDFGPGAMEGLFEHQQ